ncbi:ankyrin repeat domain-containing protein [Agrobacterium rosae]|uniref:Ankyrin repeat domain-containing protein n=1 Tax=Agrobacterium rosae TaxID=1972867 RepID=A0AAE5S1P6_9HYPH|nr:ankyrin repeat domain-containing protein [Agrobacterium rosae]KAA3510840.1 ankyrin repeat domain-containing protein [Agrobacterium rosae]KAA3517877.1 ankyrin repeat domain-containing protein [Agrobacterium rosae]MCM2434083.1 ankyrin repeat domain-containing protein [Agrobacterium rosae]MDX8329662.1 ankyrin repeat domain-containing protein [Agrobacterium rosae]MQB49416.1 ankyrin repeat domain-containing protein [Agrobacterium rosae]
MQFLFRIIVLIAVLIVSGCSDEKKDDALNDFSQEGRAIMENENLNEEQKARFKLVEIDYAKAPPEMRAIAHKIFLGQTPTQLELKALGDNINKSFPDRKPNGLYRYGRTLLITAVESHNLAAVDALLQAGADPYISIDPGHESEQVRAWNFIYKAMTQEGAQLPAPNDAYFDKTYANQLLKIYLKNGLDPNYRWPDADSLLELTIGDNFEGFKILLIAGADPWKLGTHDTPIAVRCVTLIRNARCIQYLAEKGYYDKIPFVYMEDMISAATNELEAGSRTDPDEIGSSYDEYGRYADAMRLLLERSHYALPKDSKLYRLLYIDQSLYRQKKPEKPNGN